MAAQAQITSAATMTVKGRIERFLSGPAADGFAIARLSTRSGALTIKGRGIFKGFTVGDAIEVVGRESVHPRFGKQLDATSAKTMDTAIDGLIRWIVDEEFKGVGEATARRIVERLGPDALERIKANRSLAIQILPRHGQAMHDRLNKMGDQTLYGPKLAAFDIGKMTRQKIAAAFGSDTLDVVTNDPYRLITAVDGIAFTSADKIARAAGIDAECEDRVIAAATDTLARADRDGHTWAPMSEIIAGAAERTGLPLRTVARIVDSAAPANVEHVIVGEGEEARRGWARSKIAYREERIAELIRAKLGQPKRCSREKAEILAVKHARKAGIELNSLQFEAVVLALVEPLCVITGFPGTGKTTVLKIIVECWKELGRKTKLASPTGKAADRMHEATSYPAETVHRMLGVEMGHFVHDARNPIEADSIAIDEVSMLDVSLAYSLLNASRPAQMLFLGDSEQLQSVDAGRFFGDLVDSDLVPTVRLTEIRRQAEGSNIAIGGDAIRAGEMPEWGGDLEFIEIDDPEAIAQKVFDLFAEFTRQGAEPQVLTPGHASEAGTIAMNKRLLPERSQRLTATIGDGQIVQVGDRVIQTRNDAALKISNGMTGTVTKINPDGRAFFVRFTGAKSDILIADGNRANLKRAYALSIHKTQGSEYDVVIIPMTRSHYSLLRRSLFNTGVSRAKKHCIVVGQKSAVEIALKRDDNRERRSRLASLLAA
jgi:exodeoxyribonuclease V alpha subunit